MSDPDYVQSGLECILNYQEKCHDHRRVLGKSVPWLGVKWTGDNRVKSKTGLEEDTVMNV